MSRRLTRAVAYLLPAAGLLLAGLAAGQSIQRDGFDGRAPLWQRGPTNVESAVEQSHMLTTQNAHNPPSSEYICVKSDGSTELDPYIYYSYPTHPAPLTDELSVSV